MNDSKNNNTPQTGNDGSHEKQEDKKIPENRKKLGLVYFLP